MMPTKSKPSTVLVKMNSKTAEFGLGKSKRKESRSSDRPAGATTVAAAGSSGHASALVRHHHTSASFASPTQSHHPTGSLRSQTASTSNAHPSLLEKLRFGIKKKHAHAGVFLPGTPIRRTTPRKPSLSRVLSQHKSGPGQQVLVRNQKGRKQSATAEIAESALTRSLSRRQWKTSSTSSNHAIEGQSSFMAGTSYPKGAIGRQLEPIVEGHVLSQEGGSAQEDFQTARDYAPSAGTADPAGHASGTETKRLPNILIDQATKRKCMMAQVYFLDYYFDLLMYLHHRKQRTEAIMQTLDKLPENDPARQEEWEEHCTRETKMLRKRRTRTQVSQFQVLTQVGQGGYGQVFLARKKDSGEVVALKRMSKRLIHKLEEVDHVLTERDILTSARSPWLVKLLYAFQDAASVYLAMEFVPGGDLRTLLNTKGVLLEQHARFYAAQTIVAVNELHKLGFIHRDIKPENFLIDSGGHLKLTDFGLSKGSLSPRQILFLQKKLDAVKTQQPVSMSSFQRRSIRRVQEHLGFANTLVGSPDYIAPEILANHGYDYGVDYWSLGCMIFEFLCGYPPFTAENSDDVWVNVYHWERVLERPVYEGVDEDFNLTDEAWGLVVKLITDRKNRLASLTDVAAQPFFAKYRDQWNALRSALNPPFIPKLHSDLDVSHFDDFSNPEDMELYKEVYSKQLDRTSGAGASDDASPSKNHSDDLGRYTFLGFTYKHKHALGSSAI